MVSDIQLNLTRKWRSKTFDEIVGQKLPVRLLKNSLYRGKLFPVYLLSGLRGSGKTSTGRILAAAVNCYKLKDFQENPREQSLPCLLCDSCKAMQSGKHPDFIEIDAASHTGVDNVRQIIESSAFLPSLGKKKIYLIDEAHMLSKAAFNAFLKILEEPPATALFMLATTDPQKIIETVKSRSFQLFFDPIHADDLVPHLMHVCRSEKIEYQEDALHVVVQESEGSARDALNLIERVRLSEGSVTKESVARALGSLHDQSVIHLFHVIAQGSLQGLFECMHSLEMDRYSTQVVWKKIVDLVRALIWAHHDIKLHVYSAYYREICDLAQLYSLATLTSFLDLLYRTEAQFSKTSARHPLLENMLSKMVQKCSVEGAGSSGNSSRVNRLMKKTAQSSHVSKRLKSEAATKTSEKENSSWNNFLHALQEKNNPLVNSVFQQGQVKECTQEVIQVCFPKKFEFYKDWLDANRNLWYPLLERFFGKQIVFEPYFTEQDPALNDSGFHAQRGEKTLSVKKDRVIKKVFNEPAEKKSVGQSSSRMVTPIRSRVSREKVDVSDKDTWQKAQGLLEVFPGTVSLIKE